MTRTSDFKTTSELLTRPGIIPTPMGMDAIHKIFELNGLKMVVPKDAASTRRGNIACKTYIGANDVNTKSLIYSELHGVLRGMIGDMGKLLDRKSLPLPLQEKIIQLDTHMATHKKHVDVLKKSYTDRYGNTPDAPQYDNLAHLIQILSSQFDSENNDAMRRIIKNDEEVADILSAIESAFDALADVKLKGVPEPVSNIKTNDGLRTGSMWSCTGRRLFYAGYMARAVLDTTKIPEALRGGYKYTFGDAGDGGNGIVKGFIHHVQDNPDMQNKVVVGVFEKAAEKIQDQFAQCGPFNKIKNFQLVKTAGITGSKIHTAILERVAKKNAAMTHAVSAPARPVMGKCPFGHGPQ